MVSLIEKNKTSLIVEIEEVFSFVVAINLFVCL